MNQNSVRRLVKQYKALERRSCEIMNVLAEGRHPGLDRSRFSPAYYLCEFDKISLDEKYVYWEGEETCQYPDRYSFSIPIEWFDLSKEELLEISTEARKEKEEAERAKQDAELKKQEERELKLFQDLKKKFEVRNEE